MLTPQWLVLLYTNSITKTYFENLVKALENGLADVDTSTQGASSKSTSSKSSKTKGGVVKGKGSSKNAGSSRNSDGNWDLSPQVLRLQSLCLIKESIDLEVKKERPFKELIEQNWRKVCSIFTVASTEAHNCTHKWSVFLCLMPDKSL